MTQVVKDGDRLTLELFEQGENASWNGINLQYLSPLLLGLLIPFMAINYFEPQSMQHLRTPIFAFLIAMFFICVGLFFYTAHYPGQIHSITVHRDQRAVELTWQSMLATTSQMVPFSDIQALRSRNVYDDDGYPQAVPELVVRTQEPIRLPSGTTEDHLATIRAAIGLG